MTVHIWVYSETALNQTLIDISKIPCFDGVWQPVFRGNFYRGIFTARKKGSTGRISLYKGVSLKVRCYYLFYLHHHCHWPPDPYQMWDPLHVIIAMNCEIHLTQASNHITHPACVTKSTKVQRTNSFHGPMSFSFWIILQIL